MKEKQDRAGIGEKAREKMKEKEMQTLGLVTDITVLMTAAVCVLLLTGFVQSSLLLDAALLFGILMHNGLSLTFFLRKKPVMAGVSAAAALVLAFCLLFAVF